MQGDNLSSRFSTHLHGIESPFLISIIPRLVRKSVVCQGRLLHQVVNVIDLFQNTSEHC